MNRTLWLQEYLGLKQEEEEYWKTFAKILKYTLVGVLGLNALRPETEDGHPKKWDEMTVEEREAFIPMIGWVGRAEMVKKISEQIDKQKVEDGAKNADSDSEYQDLIKAVEEGDMTPFESDIEPIEGPFKDDTLNQQYKELVQKYPSKDDETALKITTNKV